GGTSMSTTEETQTSTPFNEAPDGKPKRTRRTKAEMQAALATAEEEKQAAYPPFDPRVVGNDSRMKITAKRTVRTGQFESFEVQLHIDIQRDPRFSVEQNDIMLGERLSDDVNALADRIQRTIQVEK